MKLFSLPVIAGLALFGTLIIFIFCTETVAPGHEAAGQRFGKVLEIPITSGFHFVDPLVSYTHYDLRAQATSFDDMEIPTADQLKSRADITIQYRLTDGSTPSILGNTGDSARLRQIQLNPTGRSVIRTSARVLDRAEDLFDEDKVAFYIADMETVLREKLAGHGITIDAVLVRNVHLPERITEAINRKKEREQEVEQQRAELARVKLEQEQQVTQAEAAKNAAEFTKAATILQAQGEAEATRIRGQGDADAIAKVRKQLGGESYNDYIRAVSWDGAVPRISTGDGAGLFLQIQDQ